MKALNEIKQETITGITYTLDNCKLIVSGHGEIDKLFPIEIYQSFACTPIKEISIRGHITILNAEKAFANFAWRLQKIDLSGLDFSKVKSLKQLFWGCKNLKEVSFENNNLEHIINIRYCFEFCSQLIKVIFGAKGPKKLTDCSGAFANCKLLTYVDLNNINFSGTHEVLLDNFFYCCENFLCIDFRQNNLTQVTSLERAFLGCKKLKSIRFGTKSPKHLINTRYMCMECRDLEILDMAETESQCGFDSISTMLCEIGGKLIEVNFGHHIPESYPLQAEINLLFDINPNLKSINHCPIPKTNNNVHVYTVPDLPDLPLLPDKNIIFKTMFKRYGGINILRVESINAYYQYNDCEQRYNQLMTNEVEDAELFF